MNDDDTALQEQIARALLAVAPDWYGLHECRDLAEAALPLIHAEVKRAQAQAWEEGCDVFRVAYHIDHTDPWAHLRDNPYRTEQNDG